MQFSGVIFRVFYVEDHVICKQCFLLFQPGFFLFLFLLCLLCLELPKLLTSSGENGHPCRVPVFRGNAFNFTPFMIMFALSLSYLAFIMLIFVPSMHAFWSTLISNRCWILSKAFSESFKWFLSFNLLIWSHWLTCKYWRIFESLEKSPHCHNSWCSWYIIGFCLLEFCWVFLCLCSSVILTCSFLFFFFFFFVCDIIVWFQY